MKASWSVGLVLLGASLSACGSSDNGGGSGGAGNIGAGGTSSGAAGANAGGATSLGGAGSSSSGASNGAAGSAGQAQSAGGGNGAAGSAAGGASAGAAGSATGGAAATSTALKGVAFNLKVNGSTCDDLKTLGLSWYYAWSGTAPCPNVEFVPQIWGSWKKLNWVPTPAVAVSKGAKFLLGFNEPDGINGQSNLTVDEAIALWPDFDQPGVQIGSPAVAGQEDWMPNFMTQVAAKKLRVDFIAIHWYGWNTGACNDVSALEGKIKWAEQWQRPIWITEWSCRLHPADVTAKFYADALVMLKKHPSVVRYAWYLSRSTGDFANATLLDGAGKGTPLGNEYIAAPSTH